jgi:aryl-alcohol dehydrogenase-like predicted oxidoreductase
MRRAASSNGTILMINYQLLGKTGLRVADMCLGTMTFGEEWGWGSAQEEARKIYEYYREQGGNFIDTANVYTNGTSEKFVGEFIAGHRAEVVLATKYTNAAPGTNPNAGGNQRKSMMEAVEASLKRLQTDYIDLYWMHIWDRMTPAEEVMRGFDDLVRQGKVLYIGISDAPAWWVAKANTLAELRGWTSFAGLQIEYSLAERTPERELLPMAKEFGLTVAAWSPLAGGVLTGKYLDDAPKDQAGRLSGEMMAPFRKDKAAEDRIARTVIEIAKKRGVSAAQVSLAWLRYASVPVIPIVGAKKLSQLEDNLGATGVALDSAELKALNDASAIQLGFPHDFYEMPMVRGLVYGGLADRIKA